MSMWSHLSLRSMSGTGFQRARGGKTAHVDGLCTSKSTPGNTGITEKQSVFVVKACACVQKYVFSYQHWNSCSLLLGCGTGWYTLNHEL